MSLLAAQHPARLSRELRDGEGEDLARRRRVTTFSLVAAGSMAVIVLYQMGIIRHLPDPPAPHFDADAVDASAEAYTTLSTPDAAIGFLSYGATLMLATMGGAHRASRRPWLPLLLAAKAAADAGNAAKLTVDQWRKHRAFCGWCLLAAGATFATVPYAFAEARDAWRNL